MMKSEKKIRKKYICQLALTFQTYDKGYQTISTLSGKKT